MHYLSDSCLFVYIFLAMWLGQKAQQWQSVSLIRHLHRGSKAANRGSLNRIGSHTVGMDGGANSRRLDGFQDVGYRLLPCAAPL